MTTVFADTFYYFALLNAADGRHQQASEFTASFTGKIVTTAWVMTEVGDGLARASAPKQAPRRRGPERDRGRRLPVSRPSRAPFRSTACGCALIVIASALTRTLTVWSNCTEYDGRTVRLSMFDAIGRISP
jgi:hypothetical protein